MASANGVLIANRVRCVMDHGAASTMPPDSVRDAKTRAIELSFP